MRRLLFVIVMLTAMMQISATKTLAQTASLEVSGNTHVMYAGIGLWVKVNVSGISIDDVVLKTAWGSVERHREDKSRYVVSFPNAGLASMRVCTKDGTIIHKEIFEVRPLPEIKLKLNGKPIPKTINRADLDGRLSAYYVEDGKEYDASVISFSIYAVVNERDEDSPSKSEAFNQWQKEFVAKLPKGSWLRIDAVRVIGPMGVYMGCKGVPIKLLD